MPDNQHAFAGPMSLTQEWLDWQSRYIGAHHAAGACGISPFTQPLEIYLEKRGEKSPPEDNDDMRFGRAVEPMIVYEYGRRVGCQMDYPQPLMLSASNPFIGATLDAIAVQGDDEWALEVKSIGVGRAKRELGDDDSDEVPIDWICQAQQQMYVAGYDRCDIFALVDRRFRRFTIRRNETLIKEIVEAETELWERIKTANPPPPDYTHPKAVELMQETYGLTPQGEIDIPFATAQQYVEYERLGKEIAGLTKRRTEAKARILHALGKNALGHYGSADLNIDIERKLIHRTEYTVDAGSYIKLGRKSKR